MPLVELRAALLRDPRVGDVADENVVEAKLVLARRAAARVDEPAALEADEPAVEACHRLGRRQMENCGAEEVLADDSRPFENGTVLRIQRV